MVTLNNLHTQSSRDLAKFAKNEGVPGWHNMRKEQLIQALTRLLKRRSQSKPSTASAPKMGSKALKVEPASKVKPVATKSKPGLDSKQSSKIAIKLLEEAQERERLKNLALSASLNKDRKMVAKDRVILIVRDSYWLQVHWEVTEQTVRRAKTALEKHWRGALPVLRLYEFSDDENVPEKVVKQVEVHGGLDTWFLDTVNPPKTYRVAIGYAAPNGRFYMIAKSNKVTTPVPSGHPGNGNWADIAQDCENYFALSGGYLPDNDTRELQEVFEEKLRRPMAPLNPSNAMIIDPRSEFQFEVDAQMVVYGVAAPGSCVTLAGEPLKIDSDGTFSIRMDLPDKRQVLPVVACSRDGAHQRTTVLSIERNTKVMEPVNMDIDEP